MKWTTIGLLASLGLNIALVSFVGGRLAAGAPPAPAAPRDDERPRFLDRAGPETREAFRDAFGEHWAELRPLRRGQREGRRALRDAIAADPFDRARVEAAWAQARDSEVALRDANGAIIIDVLARLPLSERRAIAEAIAAGASRPGAPGPRSAAPRGPDPNGPPPQ